MRRCFGPLPTLLMIALFVVGCGSKPPKAVSLAPLTRMDAPPPRPEAAFGRFPPPGVSFRAALFAPDGSRLAALDNYDRPVVGRVDSGQAWWSGPPLEVAAARSSLYVGGPPLAWSPSGRSLAVGLSDDSVQIWRYAEGRDQPDICRHWFVEVPAAPATRVAFDGESAIIVAAGGWAELPVLPPQRPRVAYSRLTVRRLDLRDDTWRTVWSNATEAAERYDLSPDGASLFVGRHWYGAEPMPAGEAARVSATRAAPTAASVALVDLRRGGERWSAEVPWLDSTPPAFSHDGRRLLYQTFAPAGSRPGSPKATLRVIDVGGGDAPLLTIGNVRLYDAGWRLDDRGERLVRFEYDLPHNTRPKTLSNLTYGFLFGWSIEPLRSVPPTRVRTNVVRVADGTTARSPWVTVADDCADEATGPVGLDATHGRYVTPSRWVWSTPPIPLGGPATPPATRPTLVMPDAGDLYALPLPAGR